MNAHAWDTIDGNEAAASVAYRLSEVIAIYPITPASLHGRGLGRLVGRRTAQLVGRRARGPRDAVRGRRRRNAPRRDDARRAGDDLHLVAGSAPHAAEHVQDRRRALPRRDPRRRPLDRDARAVDLRRPQRRDGRPDDRLGDAVRRLGAGSSRLRADRPRRHAREPGPVPALLRRIPHLARSGDDPICRPTTTSRE